MQEKYINNNLIAYIGNKKRLVNLIKKSIEKVKIKNKENPKFLDLFAGTGVVSRLAKSFGFQVTANDWEYYSYVINKTFIELNSDFLDNSFKKLGNIDLVLNKLNNLIEPKKSDRYISEYYCPVNDDKIDLKNERVFYTSYNGNKIDAIRAQIEEWVNLNLITRNEEYFLIALLLYEASTRSNTSGVFKGFHRGFGGTNGDALSRILKPIQLKKPELINGVDNYIYKEDAVKLSMLLKEIQFDIAYLDPPYNQHQYGSNYHLLNTIAVNDKPPVNKNIYINGIKTNKSAIRRDWVKTRSSFCIKKTAKEDFQKILKNINADNILISYSSDGIIEFDDMLDILSEKGKLDIVISEYVKFRGGKQSLTSQINNIEFVLIVDTKQKGCRKDIEKIQKILLKNKIYLAIKKTINPIRMETSGFEYINKSKNNEIIYQKKYNKKIILLKIKNNKIVEHNIDALNLFDESIDLINEFYTDFEYITNLTREDEIYLSIHEIMKKYKNNEYKDALIIFKEIPFFISKFNNKKAYPASLKSIISVLDMLIQTIDMWKTVNLTNQSSFNKFEKIIFIKLNQNVSEEILSKNKILNNEKLLEFENIKKYKKQISKLYEYLIDELEKSDIKNNKQKQTGKIKTAGIKKHQINISNIKRLQVY